MTSHLPPQRKTVCTRRDCGHDRASHMPEVYSTGDVDQVQRTYWGACLATWCDCTEYLDDKDQS